MNNELLRRNNKNINNNQRIESNKKDDTITYKEARFINNTKRIRYNSIILINSFVFRQHISLRTV